MTNVTNEEQQVRIRLTDELKIWAVSHGADLAKLWGAPLDIYRQLLQSEIKMYEAAREQRVAMEALSNWLKSQVVQA
jgi:hypothetical protein